MTNFHFFSKIFRFMKKKFLISPTPFLRLRFELTWTLFRLYHISWILLKSFIFHKTWGMFNLNWTIRIQVKNILIWGNSSGLIRYWLTKYNKVLIVQSSTIWKTSLLSLYSLIRKTGQKRLYSVYTAFLFCIICTSVYIDFFHFYFSSMRGDSSSTFAKHRTQILSSI